MNLFLYQLKQAYSGLAKKPALVSNLVFTLGITIGALICALTLTYYMLFKPLPYPDQKQLFLVKNQLLNEQGIPASHGFTYKQAEYIYQNQQDFDELAVVYNITDVVSSHPSQPKINTAYVTNEWFKLFNIPFALGRGIEKEQGFNQFTPVAVISYNTWQQYFDHADNILEQTLIIRGITYKIIGVTAKDYFEPEIFSTGRKAEIWLPWDFNWSQQMQWGNWQEVENNIQVVAKLSNNTDASMVIHQASSQLNQAWQAQAINSPHYKNWQLKLSLTPFIKAIFGEQDRLVFYILFACIGIFIIAIANTTNLLLSRTFEQHRILSICAAMGASKRSINSQIFMEILLIALLSLPVALITAILGFEVMQSKLSALLPRVSELTLGWFSISTAFIVLAFVCLIFSRICQSTINYKALRQAISTSGKGSGVQIKRSIRQVLIISQVSIAAILIFINLTLFQHAYQEITAPMGFSVQNKFQLKLAAKDPKREKEVVRNDLLEIKAMLLKQSAVEKASISLSPLIWFGQFPVIDEISQKKYLPETKFIDEHYLPLLSQPLLTGDNFSRDDIRDRSNVVIVNDVFAKQLDTNGDVIGRYLEYWGNKHKIIGIVKGIKRPGESVIPARRYTPDMGTRPNVMIEFKPGQALTQRQLIEKIEQITSQYDVFLYSEMKSDRTRLLFPQYTIAIITAILTLLTVFLATIGLFGILSYSSQMRRFEIGTRMAIGAKGRDIIKMIVKDNMSALAIGLVFSSFILLILYLSFSQSLVLYISQALIPLFIITMLIIGVISFFACYLPLRKYITKPALYSLRGSN